MKRVLITGANSYIGESFEKWAKSNYPDQFQIDTLDMIDGSWRDISFSGYDAVFHVAGIAHADVGKVSEEQKAFYYKINRDLAVETAQKAKEDNVRQFVFMSSMIIYGGSARLGRQRVITGETRPNPENFYGDSKWQADQRLRGLEEEEFQVAVLRPPMIYGKGSKGNYPLLAKLARKLPVFPDIKNERSMLHIDNLCEFLCMLIQDGRGGIYFPQNKEYVRTSDIVRKIARIHGHRIWVTKILNPVVWVAEKIPGKISGLINKAFGSLIYDKSLSDSYGWAYQVCDFSESIRKTED
ncbi:MAG: NAD-dependent epimerase/dehydratase family protein [Lachnospiraceae bacterium]|jgi:nucleoside-diphosphate-sugar epimerase|nr:NAD-dependent epimerase/dehydratase family protein [Lachnospiraceae bacterium]